MEILHKSFQPKKRNRANWVGRSQNQRTEKLGGNNHLVTCKTPKWAGGCGGTGFMTGGLPHHKCRGTGLHAPERKIQLPDRSPNSKAPSRERNR